MALLRIRELEDEVTSLRSQLSIAHQEIALLRGQQRPATAQSAVMERPATAAAVTTSPTSTTSRGVFGGEGERDAARRPMSGKRCYPEKSDYRKDSILPGRDVPEASRAAMSPMTSRTESRVAFDLNAPAHEIGASPLVGRKKFPEKSGAWQTSQFSFTWNGDGADAEQPGGQQAGQHESGDGDAGAGGAQSAEAEAALQRNLEREMRDAALREREIALLDYQLSASSELNSSTRAGEVRMNGGGWSPDPNKANHFLQIDSVEPLKIGTIVMTGGPKVKRSGENVNHQHVLRFKLKFSNDRRNWDAYKIRGEEAVFENNAEDPDELNVHDLPTPLAAHYVRIYPVVPRSFAMRVALYKQ